MLKMLVLTLMSLGSLDILRYRGIRLESLVFNSGQNIIFPSDE